MEQPQIQEIKNKGGRPEGTFNCGKCNKPKSECNCGRPTKMTPEVIGKLEEAFAIDSSIEEASFYAGIHRDTYYEWIKNNPELSDRFEALRNRPVLKARQEVVKGLDDDKNFSFKYLSRKRPHEFGDKLQVEHSGGVTSQHNVAFNTPEFDALKAEFEKRVSDMTSKTWDPPQEEPKPIIIQEPYKAEIKVDSKGMQQITSTTEEKPKEPQTNG